MRTPTTEAVVFHGSAGVAVVSLAALYALRYEGPLRRWLDRRIDRATTLPAPTTGRGVW